MDVDMTKLMTCFTDEIDVEGEVVIPCDLIDSSEIRELKNTCFKGSITKLCNDDYSIDGELSGVMVLGDAITLEDVDYPFSTHISEEFGQEDENNLKIVQNHLDITEFLWQNILVEIPLRVVSEKNKDLKLEGNGWRLITEEDLDLGNDSPFNELKTKFESRKE